MKKESLSDILYLAGYQHDENAMLQVINKFSPVLRSTARKLNYDGAESDLIIDLIEKVQKMNFEKIRELGDGQLVNYISHMIRNKGIDIIRNRRKQIDEIYVVSIYEVPDCTSRLEYDIWNMLESLNDRQKTVIVLRYFYGYSDIEIGEKLGITRQAVNKLHRKSIKILKRETES